MKIFIISLVVMGLLVGGAVFAQETTIIEEEVTSEDLGIEDPGLLPTSPFYFFKEWRRGVQSFFTFNPVAKVELELRFVNEKAAEAKEVQELRGDDESAMNRAIENYRKSQEKLASRLEALSETSENPNIDKLLDKIAERVILHEKLFDEIELKVKAKIEVRDGIASIRERIKVTVGRIAEKDEPEKFKVRLEKVFKEVKGGALKHVRSVEFLDRVDGVLSEEKRESLSKLRDKLSLELKDKLEIEVNRDGVEKLKARIKNIAGDGIDRTILFEELRARASDKLSRALRGAEDELDEEDEDRGERMKEKAREQVQRAIDVILKVRNAMADRDVSQAVSTLVARAEKNIVIAKESLLNENYTNAFGQARSAETAARNALSILSGRSSVDSIVKPLERVKNQLRDIAPVIPSQDSSGRDSSGTICTLEYSPVCGANGETYSNECFAKASGAKIVKRGACEKVVDERPSIIDDLRTRLIEPLQIKIDTIEPIQIKTDAVEPLETKTDAVTNVNE